MAVLAWQRCSFLSTTTSSHLSHTPHTAAAARLCLGAAMDKWAPLAPTPRFTLAAARSSAGQYARASLSLPGLEGDDEAPGAGGGSSSSSSTRRRRDTAEPLVGRLPVSVVRRILAHLPLADLPSCALAARALARVVAAEETWRPRLEALDWVTAPGSAPPALPNDAAEMAPRYLGRRRLRSPAEEAALLKAPTSATPATATSAAEDDFGDFKTSAASPVDDDAFGDFTSAPPARVPGGSLAAGLASVARPAAGRASPVKSRAATALFSYAAEVSLPLAAKASPSFVTLRALVASLRAPLRSLPASGSLGAELPLAAQGALVANCLRYFSADVGGGSRRPSASLATLLPLVQGVAREVAAASLSAFKSSMARREDALRAASHGADTARATRRAEDGMRSSADVAWEVGKALGDGKGASGSAKAFLKSRKVLGLARKHDATANVV
jgi:recyclin-1